MSYFSILKIMKRLFFGAALVMLLFPAETGAQSPTVSQTIQATQTVRGQVCDVASGEVMIGVTITVENGVTLSTVSDNDGNFVISNVPVGRHSVRATYIGYEPVLLQVEPPTAFRFMVTRPRCCNGHQHGKRDTRLSGP